MFLRNGVMAATGLPPWGLLSQAPAPKAEPHEVSLHSEVRLRRRQPRRSTIGKRLRTARCCQTLTQHHHTGLLRKRVYSRCHSCDRVCTSRVECVQPEAKPHIPTQASTVLSQRGNMTEKKQHLKTCKRLLKSVEFHQQYLNNWAKTVRNLAVSGLVARRRGSGAVRNEKRE